MSILKADAVTAAQSNTSITVKGAGSGIVKLGDGELKFPDADGSAGQFIKTDGSAQLSFAAAGGAWNLIGTAVASGSASLTITGLDSTYDTYAIGISDMVPATDDVGLYLRFGDSSGVDSGASDYTWGFTGTLAYDASWAVTGVRDDEDAQIKLGVGGGTGSTGNGSGDGIGAMIYLHRPGDGTMRPSISGTFTSTTVSTYANTFQIGGMHNSVITLDRINVLFSSGNIATGRMTVWGIAHA